MTDSTESYRFLRADRFLSVIFLLHAVQGNAQYRLPDACLADNNRVHRLNVI